MLPDRPIFRGLVHDQPVQIYQRNLPHWRQEGATYFTTFRLADSIPRFVLESWELSRRIWLEAHGIQLKWQVEDPERYAAAYHQVHEIERQRYEKEQAKQLHVELDRCHGCCVLQDKAVSECVAEALMFEADHWWVGDFVIMPNHVHLLVQPLSGFPLEESLGSIKKFVSRQLKTLDRERERWMLPEGSLWQHESYDRIVRDDTELGQYRKYIANNPSKAKLHFGSYRHYAAEWLDDWAPRTEVA